MTTTNYISTPGRLYVSTSGGYSPISYFDETVYSSALATLNIDLERKNNMEVRDRICDKCGKRYSIVTLRVETDTGYTDKEGYLDNQTPLENYPKVYHSRADKKNVGREMDLCSECAEALKKFAEET